MATVYIYDALRTPRGRGKAGKGGLSNHHPQELLAQTLNQMAARKKLDKSLVEDVAMGCVTQVKEQGSDIARNALIASNASAAEMARRAQSCTEYRMARWVRGPDEQTSGKLPRRLGGGHRPWRPGR